MFAKLLITIFSLGLIAAALLVIRQQRIDIAHDMAKTHQRIVEQESQLWRLRAEVVRRCRPEDVRAALERSGLVWQTIPQNPPGTNEVQTHYAEGRERRSLVEG